MEIKKQHKGFERNIGFAGVLLVVFIQSALSVYYWPTYMAEIIVMNVGMIIVVTLTLLSYRTASKVFAISLTIGYLLQRLFCMIGSSHQINIEFLLWFILPMILYFMLSLFFAGSAQLNQHLDILIERQEELMTISHKTDLYNQKGLLLDIRMQQAYCERNNLALSLMLLQVNLKEEAMDSISDQNFYQFLKDIGIMITDTVRIEDRVYSIDDNGIFGILLICSREASEHVRTRLCGVLENRELFTQLSGGRLETDVKIACGEYDRQVYQNDAALFLHSVLNSLQDI